MKIGVDVDGVLANFCKGYAELMATTSGRKLFTDEEIKNPSVWNWDQKAGYTDEEISQTWQAINRDPHWWANLEPLPDAEAFLDRLQVYPEVYFITARSGPRVQDQTAGWLWDLWMDWPSVIISANKGGVCAALEIDYYLDDRWENIESVSRLSPMTNAFLLNYRHNSQQWNMFNRLNSIMDFLELIR